MTEQATPQRLGEFELVGELGRGGSGVVYDARWGPRRVALKVLHAELIASEKARALFLAEAQRLQAITHVSVIKVLAAGVLADGRPYLAMERLEGETLASAILRAPLALPHAIALFGELCAAVGALHAIGLVHRDLKPENVFVVDGKHAVLLDFGIAKDVDAPSSTTTQAGSVRGTPAYMAPERFFGQPAGIATDVYELAVTLYAMIAGRLPWDDVADPEARLAPRPIDNVPRELDVEIRRALSTRAQNRPVSPATFCNAVLVAAAGTAEPTAGETARLRPAPAAAPSERSAPPDDVGTTPLGWAPTLPATTSRSPRRGRWLGVAGFAAAIVAATTFAWRSHANHESAVTSAPTREPSIATADPWSASGQPTANAQPTTATVPPATPDALVAPAPTPEAARAAAAKLLARLPTDTRIVATVQLAEVRANPAFERLLENLANDPRVKMLDTIAPTCLLDAVRTATWIVVGAPSFDNAAGAIAIVGGRWQRNDVVRCLAADTAVTAAAGDSFQLGGAATMGFLDDHTLMLSVGNAAVGATASRAVASAPSAPHGTRHALELVARQPTDVALALAIDGAGKDWPEDALPRGTDLRTWLRLSADGGASFEFIADPHTAAAAATLEHSVRVQLDDTFAKLPDPSLGNVDVSHERTAVVIRGQLGAPLLQLLVGAIK